MPGVGSRTDGSPEAGSYLQHLTPVLRRYFALALTGDRQEDFLRALAESGNEEAWEEILMETRNLWSTASLIMGAGLEDLRDNPRFVALKEKMGLPR